jgi:hypothetical protein
VQLIDPEEAWINITPDAVKVSLVLCHAVRIGPRRTRKVVYGEAFAPQKDFRKGRPSLTGMTGTESYANEDRSPSLSHCPSPHQAMSGFR